MAKSLALVLPFTPELDLANVRLKENIESGAYSCHTVFLMHVENVLPASWASKTMSLSDASKYDVKTGFNKHIHY